ncbi:MAG: lysostaphin resistance A-like protein [bacterium]
MDSKITTEENQNLLPPEVEAPPTLNFKQAFWLIAAFILVFQIFALILYFVHSQNATALNSSYYLQLVTASIVWDFALIYVVLANIRTQQFSALRLFNLKLTHLLDYAPKVLKYFSGCAILVVLLSLFTDGTELHLEYQTPLVRVLSILSAVVVAPVIEEMIFRGYLYTAMLPSFKHERERLVVNAMFFAAAHVFLVTLFFGVTIPYYILILGYLLAKLYEESRSILPCILLHFLNNSLVVVIDLVKLDSLNY